LGQILSTREDLIPQEYIEELSKLQDSVPPVSFKKIKKLLDLEFKTNVFNIFDDIEVEPIASASLAQVHVAQLHGEKVVLKILRPGVEELIKTDLRLLPLIAVLFETFTRLGRTNILMNVVSEFSRVLSLELDFTHEASNLEKFRLSFRDNPSIVIPRIYPKYSTRHVLTLEYIEGIKISCVDAIKASGVDEREIVNILVKCYLQQVLVSGFFHADPHPGNIAVTRDGKVAFFDFGMMVHFPKHVQKLIIKAAIAGARRDMGDLIQSLIELGILDPDANQEALRKTAHRIVEVFDRENDENGEKGLQKIKQVIAHLHRIAQDFSIALPPYLVYLFKTMPEVESICMRLMPTL
jgi:ubiquinone biosynthesis protein